MFQEASLTRNGSAIRESFAVNDLRVASAYQARTWLTDLCGQQCGYLRFQGEADVLRIVSS